MFGPERLAKVEKIVLKNFHRNKIEDAHKSFTNYCAKERKLDDNIGY